MALTKTEAAKLTNDMLLAGVVETIVQESPVLRYLPFMEVQGNELRYNQEATNPSASFYDVGDTWTEATPTFNSRTAALRIIGGDADIDAFLQQTYSSVQDLEAAIIAERAKAVAYAFSDSFYNGDSSANPKQFDGLKKLITSPSQIEDLGANGGNLTLDAMDSFLDRVKPGRPDVILCSKRTRRKLNSLRRASGSVLETDVDQFGRHVLYYDGIPVEVDDSISDSETKGTANNCSTMYAVKFGFQTGLMGIENGGIQVEDVGMLETKNARRWRIKWYVGLVLFREIAAAKMVGILP